MLGVGRIHAYAGSLEGTRAGERAAGDADGLVADLDGIDLRSEAGRYTFFYVQPKLQALQRRL